MFITIFYEPILGGKLLQKYDMKSDEVAYFFSIFSISVFSTNLFLTFFPLKKRFMLWIVVSSVFSVLSILLMGPSRLLQIPDNLIVMAVGTGMLGVARQVYSVSMVVHTLQPLYKMFPGQTNRISKLFAAFRQIAIAFAFFSSPFYASGVTSVSSYETTCDSVAIILLVYLTVFLGVHLS